MLFKNGAYYYGREEIAELIKRFVNDDYSLDAYAWDDFMSVRLGDPYEAFIQQIVGIIEANYPPDNSNSWCSDDGGKVLIQLAEAIQYEKIPFPPTKDDMIELSKGLLPERYRKVFCPQC